MSDLGGTPFGALVTTGQVLVGTLEAPAVTAADSARARFNSAFCAGSAGGAETIAAGATTSGVTAGDGNEDAEASPGNCPRDDSLAPCGKVWDRGLSTTASRVGSCTFHATMPALPNATEHSIQTILALIWAPTRATGLVADRARRADLSTKGTGCIILTALNVGAATQYALGTLVKTKFVDGNE